MCLIVLSFDPDSAQQLIVLANRDELYNRATDQAHFWTEHSGLLAGRDNLAGGTWLGVHTSGRFAAVTNFREPGSVRADSVSRGELTVDFLNSQEDSETFLSRIQSEFNQYNGFNLLVYDGKQLGYGSNRSPDPPRLLEKGLYGVSNDLLDTAWPKVTRSKSRMREVLHASSHSDFIWSDSSFLDILADETIAPDNELPDTGVGMDWERVLSAMTIRSETYGTRCTTLVGMMQNGSIRFVEKTLQPSTLNPATVQFEIQPREDHLKSETVL